MIHVKTPYALDKNLGRAYNIAFEGVPDNDWVCLIDYDVCFLSSNTIRLMHEYIESYNNVGIFTCFTNRIHPLAKDQLMNDEPSEIDSIKFWVKCASDMEKKIGIHTTLINHPISGFLMLISKETWNEIKFNELGQCLGVDNIFSQEVLKAGLKILRMDSILVWHTYRIHDITDKTHLK